jgi:hypothetical protein
MVKIEIDAQPEKMNRLDLTEIARQSMNFSEFHERVNRLYQQPQRQPADKFTKHQDIDINLQQLAVESDNFGEYLDKVRKLRGRK